MPLKLPPEERNPSAAPARSLVLHAFSSMRSGPHDLQRLLEAADAGQVPLDVPNEQGLPVLAVSVSNWPPGRAFGGAAWASPAHPRHLARFQRGQSWDGTGACKDFEVLAATLLAAGADPFPNDSLVNLEHAIRAEAPATAVSLLADPACPPLAQADPTSRLLRLALSYREPCVVRALLDAGCDPNAVDSKGEPAWFAVRRPDELAWLAEAGARLDMVDGQGRAAPQAWSANRRGESGTLQALGQALGRLAGPCSPAPREGAFEAAFDLQVGPLRTWLAQDPAALAAARPVPGLEGRHETIAQRVLRMCLVRHGFFRGSQRDKPPPMGLLRLLIEHPTTPPADRAAVAVVALGYGNTLVDREAAAKRAFEQLAPSARALIQDPGHARVGWNVLAGVLGRHADGALPTHAADQAPVACRLFGDIYRHATTAQPACAPLDAVLAAFHVLCRARTMPASALREGGQRLGDALSSLQPPAALEGLEPALGALLATGLSSMPPPRARRAWARTMKGLLAHMDNPTARSRVAAVLDQVAGAGGFPDCLAPQVADLSRQLLDVALEAPAPTRLRVRV